jgi:8-oxo-dGTP pyrophosphatase MutT (NUDIX family)
MDHLQWREKNRRQMFENHLFRLVLSEQQAPDGRVGTFTLLECGDWVNVVALTEDGDGHAALLMVRQYRFGGRQVALEFPGGVIEPGEDTLEAAKRELLEETGYTAGRWEKLGDINPNPSFMVNRTHTWLARDLRLSAAQNLDANEIIDVHVVPVAELQAGAHPDFEVNAIMLVTWYWFERWLRGQAATGEDRK